VSIDWTPQPQDALSAINNQDKRPMVAKIFLPIVDPTDENSIIGGAMPVLVGDNPEENLACGRCKSVIANYNMDEYVGCLGASVNQIGSFWPHLKRSIQGTHISVSPKYLGHHTKEFELRFNLRSEPAPILLALISPFRPLPCGWH
jgi:hypothetical protein